MDKPLLAQRLQYPDIWLAAGLLTDEYYELQVREYLREYGEDRVPEGGTEHWRYGAFLYCLTRLKNIHSLDDLLSAALQDPDRPMAGVVIGHIIKHDLSNRAMLDRALIAARSFREYHLSPSQLEKSFLDKAKHP